MFKFSKTNLVLEVLGMYSTQRMMRACCEGITYSTSDFKEKVTKTYTLASVKFSYSSLYLKNNTYLQQEDSKSPFDNYFSDKPLRAL